MSSGFPVGWSKTIADLFVEAKKTNSSVGPPETEWARAYEQSLLRPWARFPLDGEVYEAIEDTPVSFLTHFRAPFTDGGTGIIPKGTKVRVKVTSFATDPISVYADPLNHTSIEQLLVPPAILADAKYGGFSLSISTAELNTKYHLIKGVEQDAV